MEKHLPRSLGYFAAFFCTAMPAFAALAAAALHKPHIHMMGERGAGAHWLANLYFNHFAVALCIPVAAGLLTGTLALLTARRNETELVGALAKLFVLQAISAMTALAWTVGLHFAVVLG